MKTRLSAKGIVLLFLVALAVYLGGFYGIEHLRHRKGPWSVTFVADAAGQPALQINQPALNIRDVTILFPDQPALTATQGTTVRFDVPSRPVPFGRVLFEDLTFLPGVVALDVFGHEIELLPRMLLVDRQPVAWASDTVIALAATNPPAASPPNP